jgi:hypothetical protein
MQTRYQRWAGPLVSRFWELSATKDVSGFIGGTTFCLGMIVHASCVCIRICCVYRAQKDGGKNNGWAWQGARIWDDTSKRTQRSRVQPAKCCLLGTVYNNVLWRRVYMCSIWHMLSWNVFICGRVWAAFLRNSVFATREMNTVLRAMSFILFECFRADFFGFKGIVFLRNFFNLECAVA